MPGFSSIRWRIAVPFCLMTALVFAGLYFYSLSQLRQFQFEQQQNRLSANASFLSGNLQLRDGLASSRWQAGDIEPVRLVHAWGNQLEARVTIFLADGNVLADSSVDPTSMESQLDQPEILSALLEGTGHSVRTSGATGFEMLYAAAAVARGGDPGGADADDFGQALGVVRLSSPSSEIDAAMDPLRRAILILFLLTYAALVGLALSVSEGTARPFRNLIQAAARLAQGELGVRIEPKGTDEAGQLARVFNRMRDRLESQVASVSRERERLTSVLDNLVDGVFILDSEGRVRLCNLVATRMVGFDMGKGSGSTSESEEASDAESSLAPAPDSHDGTPSSNLNRKGLRGQPLALIVRDHRIVETWQDCRQDGKQAESIFQWGDRTTRVIALPFVAGGSDGFVVLLQDMTELHRLERVRTRFCQQHFSRAAYAASVLTGAYRNFAGRRTRRPGGRTALPGPDRDGGGCPCTDGAGASGAFPHRIRSSTVPLSACSGQ